MTLTTEQMERIIDNGIAEINALRTELAAAREDNGRKFLQIRKMESDCLEHCQDWTRAQMKLNETRQRLADLQGKLKDIREVLRDLFDCQNGCPLFKYEKQWNAAMERASAILQESKT